MLLLPGMWDNYGRVIYWNYHSFSSVLTNHHVMSAVIFLSSFLAVKQVKGEVGSYLFSKAINTKWIQSEPQSEFEPCSLIWFSILITVRFQMFLFFKLHHCFKELIAYYSRNFSEIWAKFNLIHHGSLLWKLFFSVDMRNKRFFF